MPSTPSRKPELAEAIERSLRRNGFFILERSWNAAGDCLIRFRAILSPHQGIKLSHELLINALEEPAEFADWMDGFIKDHRAGWAPVLEVMQN